MADPRDPTINFTTSPDSNRGFQYPRSGLNNVGEYQASGLPWVSQSNIGTSAFQFTFPYVTNEIIVKNDGTDDVHFGWSELGVANSNRFTLAQSEQITLRVRTNYIWFLSSGSSTVNVFAALTTIDKKQFPVLSGAYADPVTGQALFLSESVGQRVYGYDGIG